MQVGEAQGRFEDFSDIVSQPKTQLNDHYGDFAVVSVHADDTFRELMILVRSRRKSAPRYSSCSVFVIEQDFRGCAPKQGHTSPILVVGPLLSFQTFTAINPPCIARRRIRHEVHHQGSVVSFSRGNVHSSPNPTNLSTHHRDHSGEPH